jgi:ankyrin repeat protein
MSLVECKKLGIANCNKLVKDEKNLQRIIKEVEKGGGFNNLTIVKLKEIAKTKGIIIGKKKKEELIREIEGKNTKTKALVKEKISPSRHRKQISPKKQITKSPGRPRKQVIESPVKKKRSPGRPKKQVSPKKQITESPSHSRKLVSPRKSLPIERTIKFNSNNVIEAIKNNDITTLKQIKVPSFKTLTKNNLLNIIFHNAISVGNIDILNELINNWGVPFEYAKIIGKTNSKSPYSTDDMTPIMRAAKNGNLDVLKWLKEWGLTKEDIIYENIFGYTALMLAAETGHADVLREFRINWNINYHDAIVKRKDNEGRTLFLIAAKSGDVNVLDELRNWGFSMNYIKEKDKYRNTALILATENGNIDVIKELFKNWEFDKYDINVKNTYGESALDTAIENDYINIINLLIEHGADITKVSDKQKYANLIKENEKMKRSHGRPRKQVSPRKPLPIGKSESENIKLIPKIIDVKDRYIRIAERAVFIEFHLTDNIIKKLKNKKHPWFNMTYYNNNTFKFDPVDRNRAGKTPSDIESIINNILKNNEGLYVRWLNEIINLVDQDIRPGDIYPINKEDLNNDEGKYIVIKKDDGKMELVDIFVTKKMRSEVPQNLKFPQYPPRYWEDRINDSSSIWVETPIIEKFVENLQLSSSIYIPSQHIYTTSFPFSIKSRNPIFNSIIEIDDKNYILICSGSFNNLTEEQYNDMDLILKITKDKLLSTIMSKNPVFTYDTQNIEVNNNYENVLIYEFIHST